MSPRTLILSALLVHGFLLDAPPLQAAGDVTEQRILVESARGDNWFVKGGNFRGDHFSPLTKISEKNVADLGLVWASNLPIPDGISATPIVVDSVIYLSGAFSVVFAIDATDGRVLWTFDPNVRAAFSADPGMSWIARVNRGVAVWHGKVLMTTADCRLIALDAKTGKRVWVQQTCDIDLGYSISDSPYVGGNKVFVGNAGSESYEKNRGYVSAYDVDTGKMLWRFFTVPSDDPAENKSPAMKMAAKTWSGDALKKFGGGGSNWNEMTYDPESGLLFFGTGGAVPYVHSVRSPDGGDNLFLSSILAIDADSGEYVWHYQTVPEDSWEYNATMNIVLADLKIDGKNRKVLMTAPKNGFHYVIDRLNGELLAADKYAKVNWATHINMETGRPVYSPEAEYWKRPNESVAIWPNMWGSHSWQPTAWHPELRLAYIPVIDVPSVVSNYADGDFDDTLEMVTEIDGKSFSPGKLIAWDPAAHRARWTVEHELPFNGGILATAGNLVFQGNANGEFVAYAADSGEVLWSLSTGSAILAAPVTYTHDGEQYVLIPIGSSGGVSYSYPTMHSSDEANGPTRLLAFAVDGKAKLPTTPITERPVPAHAKLDATPETINEGRQLYASACKGCHGKNAVARFGGSVPDLRYASSTTHASWNAIVIDGARQPNGMPKFDDLSTAESEAIRSYVQSLSEKR